jgi:membrane-associated protein
MHLDLIELVKTGGPLIVALIVFVETGLLIGFFLPGDSLLFTAGALASKGYINLWTLIILVPLAAVVGDALGFRIGRKLGNRLYLKKDSVIFKKEHIVKSEQFFSKHGGKSVILARFIPVVRTFTPVIAGASNMSVGQFSKYNVVGGILWGVGLTMLGYVIGNNFSGDIDKIILPIVVSIVIISVLPGVITLIIGKLKKKQEGSSNE